MTDFEDCFRLLPNHRLDLDTWTTRRFWPVTAREPDPLSEVDRHVSHAVERLRNNMLAIHGTGLTVYSPLTAGRDSRTILACTPAEIRPDITYITLCFEEKGFGYVVDQHIGQLLAKRHNLKHLAVGVSEGSEQDKKQYFYRIGRAGGAGKTSRFYRTPLQSMDMNAIWLTGHGGAVAKRHYSVEARGRRLRLTATELLRRARLPLKEDFLAATDRWIQALPPDCSTELVLDLFYMEYRLGGWGAPHLYGTAPFRVKVIPYSDRRFVDACFSMPYKYRERYQAQGRMIELCDPELLKTPFQQLTGWEKWKRRLRLNRF